MSVFKSIKSVCRIYRKPVPSYNGTIKEKEVIHMTVRAKSLVTLSLAASMIGCAAFPAFASDSKKDEENVTIRVAWWGNQTRNDLTVKALELYTEQHPNVTFETEPSSWDGYFDKLATQAATGSLPDIYQQD